jgi:hypothetical protein
VRDPRLLAENIRRNAKFGKGESILAQNAVMDRVEVPSGIDPLVYLGSGPVAEWELGAPRST